MDALRVMVVDDHPVFRAGLVTLLDAADGLEPVGQAGDGEEAVRRAASLAPDVVVMDLRMPGGSGLDATRRILEHAPGTRILLLTMHDDDRSLLDALRAGARGYVLKGAAADDVVRAIRAVGHGEAIFGPGLADRILALVAAGSAPRPFPELSDRELEVLEHLAGGASSGQIAIRLGVAPKTVRNHLSTICNKLQVTDRFQAVLRARAAGIARPEDRG